MQVAAKELVSFQNCAKDAVARRKGRKLAGSGGGRLRSPRDGQQGEGDDDGGSDTGSGR